MKKANTNHNWLNVILILFCFISCLDAITQRCQVNNNSPTIINQNYATNECPLNSKCNNQGYCVCERGYFGNCLNNGSYINTQQTQFQISQNISYFLIQPIANQFVTFQFILCNEKSLNNDQLLNLWVDDGKMVQPNAGNALGSDKDLRVQEGCMALVTSYFTFNLQPNGQTQTLILGIKLRNPDKLKIQIIVQQISIFGFDIIFKIIIILVSAIVLISVGGFAYCIYKMRRRRRFNTLNEEKFDITYFDEYMPSKKADLQQMKEQICSVCLGQFKQNEEIRPTVCSHYFHKNCLDEWCVTNLSCPICRTSFQKPNLIHQQYLLGRRNSQSTNQNQIIQVGRINGQSNLRDPIV